ncbi:HNH endonuclease [Patescibacteria group bacterium]|nr:HNH endonuclease [Patescibacteria group bacterium]MBU1951911.1 HNH endonuclease [Patescibacteria group bacterium]
MPQSKCKICSKEFYVKPSHQKLGYGKYCSRDCAAQGRRKGKYILCEICGSEVWKMPKHIRNSKSKKYFCSKSCQTKWRNKEFSGTKHPNWKGGEYTYHRVMIKHKIKPICSNCGIKDKRILVIHHKDHNRKNNEIDNLIWLCRNCHYLIHNRKTI